MVGLVEITSLFATKNVMMPSKCKNKLLSLQKKCLNAFFVQLPCVCVCNHSVHVDTVDSTGEGEKGEWRRLVQQNAICN